MADRSAVDFIEEWQSGFFLIIGIAILGVATGIAIGSIFGPSGFLPGFLGGGALAFLAYSYLRYGR